MTTSDVSRQSLTPTESFYFPDLAQSAAEPYSGEPLQVKPALRPQSAKQVQQSKVQAKQPEVKAQQPAQAQPQVQPQAQAQQAVQAQVQPQQQAAQQQVTQQAAQLAAQQQMAQRQAAQQQAIQQQIAQQQAARQQAQLQAAQQRAIKQQQAAQLAAQQAAQQKAAQQQAAQQQAVQQQAMQQQAAQQKASVAQQQAQQQVTQQAAAQQQVQKPALQPQTAAFAAQNARSAQQATPQQAQPAQPVQQAQPASKSASVAACTAQQQPSAKQQQAQPQPQQPQGAYYAPQPAQPVVINMPAQPTAEKKSRGWIVAVVFIVCMFAFTAFCVKACSDAVVGLGSTNGKAVLTRDTVAVINLDGTIQYDGSACSPEGLKELLDEAEADSHIKAVVIRMNSGGGTATAGEEMSEYLKNFSKPVVVSSASINASAAYMISAQSDYIYVAHSTEIGAIGTAMQLTDLSGLLDMLGISMEVITSSDSKDSSYGYRALTDDERAYYQDMVNKINNMFVQEVMDGRHMTEEQVRAFATGMPFTGDDAVANGLADAIGSREDACAKAAELAGISSYDTTELYLKDYNLSSLSGLLGQSEFSVEDIAKITALAREVGLL